jgi:putative ABC transport system permease protein
MAAGRNFLKSMTTDSNEAFILNETAVRKIGWGSPGEAVGSEFKYGKRRGRVIGVVKDFHFESLRWEIAPVVMQMSKSGLEAILIRIKPENLSGTLSFLEKKWKAYHPNLPFRWVFLNEKFDHEYILEKVIIKIFYYFAFLAIFIASLGLFGLASFSAEQRTKEIGIRKVLGASVIGIVRFISRDFTRCVLTANIIAWPAAYFVMSWILQGYAYRTRIGIGTFLIAGALALIISLLTISYQSIKAASANPIKALRYE